MVDTSLGCAVVNVMLFWGGRGAALRGLQDLSSRTRDQTRASAVKALSPNHWTTREFPQYDVNVTGFKKNLLN